MKKLVALAVLALMAVAGTGLAVTCAYDNVPGATLLIPYFKVSRNNNASISTNIPAGGTDTLVTVTNTSGTGLIAHVMVFNKYSMGVLDFNVPMTGFDVFTMSMRDVLNGNLNVNTNTQNAERCIAAGGTGVAGFAQTRYERFGNPDPALGPIAISNYATPAFQGSFRQKVWSSLDESFDIAALGDVTVNGIIDTDNPACGLLGNAAFRGDYTGYVLIDVSNACNMLFSFDPQMYTQDLIATVGWSAAACPAVIGGCNVNALMGDVFFLDPSATGGNISGDPAVAIEFDNRLTATLAAPAPPAVGGAWGNPGPDILSLVPIASEAARAPAAGPAQKTFYSKYHNAWPFIADTGAAFAGVPVAFQAIGDGREPLGSRYGWRFLNTTAAGTLTWALIWRSDIYAENNVIPIPLQSTLCAWMQLPGAAPSNANGLGFNDPQHQVLVITRDLDERQVGVTGGPSGGDAAAGLFVLLETGRYSVNQIPSLTSGFANGWIDMTLTGYTSANAAAGSAAVGVPAGGYPFAQGWIGVQHSGAGLAISVGHSATLLQRDFLCVPAAGTAGAFYTAAGNIAY